MAGRPPDVPDIDILRAIRDFEYPFMSTAEIGQEVGFKSPADSARPRLKHLEERNLVSSRKIGRYHTWWITEEGRDHLNDEGD